MSAEAVYVPLGELVDPARGISYGVVQPGSHHPGGTPIVRVTDVRDGRIATKTPLRVDESVVAKHQRTVLRGGELLLTIVGTVGETAIVPPQLRGWNTARAVAVLPVNDEPGPRWVQYALRTGSALEYVKSRLNTTVQATLNLGDVAKLPVPMPPAAIRERALSVLGALDDKIELNRRTNETLEAMARALFKSWFVDFDPVRAKAEGRTPTGMDAETAALFPSELVDSALGYVPNSWHVGSIRDVASNRRDTVHPSKMPSGSSYLGLEHLPRGRVFLEELGTPEELGSLKARFHAGDVLFGKLRPYFKKVVIAPCDGICSTDILVLTPQVGCSAYVALAAASEAFIDHAVALSDGTRMPRTSWEQLSRFAMAIPSIDILAAFERQVTPMFKRAESTRKESITLAQLRDELLPRLLSGAISPSRQA